MIARDPTEAKSFPLALRFRAPLSTQVGELLAGDADLVEAGYEVIEVQRGSTGPHVLFVVYDDEGLAVLYAASTAAALAAGTEGVAAMSDAWDDGRSLREKALCAAEELRFPAANGGTVDLGGLAQRLAGHKGAGGDTTCRA